MKKILLTTVAFAILAATPAFAAGSADTSIVINATAEKSCTLTGGTTVTLTAPNGTTAIYAGEAPAAVALAAMCNNKFKLDLDSTRGAVRATTAVPVLGGAFDQAIAYTATPTFVGATGGPTPAPGNFNASLTSATAAPATVASVTDSTGAFNGTLNIALATATSANPLVAGAYSDTLKVTITAL
jgi:hypothetical protein